MSDEKAPDPKVEFSGGTKALELKSKKSSPKTKIIVIGVLTAFLLLGAVVSVAVFFTLKKTTSTRLVEVNLEEGETLTYQVDQDIDVQVGNVQKGKTILTAMLQYILVSFKTLTVTYAPLQLTNTIDILATLR